ncbi:hypothetical protein BDN72DRAFT_768745, partial [Pluteus cervinus]
MHQIDQEINALEGRILSLRTARNRLAPVSRIPMEVLTEIFSLTQDISDESYGRAALVISWVCQHWREMALGFPALWSCIDLTHIDCVQAFLERSK